MKFDIAFLSRLIPREMDAEVRRKMIGMMEDEAIAWQENIIEGIEIENGGPLHLINYLPVNAYPNTYKDPFIKKRKFSHIEGAEDINLGFCNVRYIKRFQQWIPLFQEIDKWAKTDLGLTKVLIVYTMYPEFMMAIKHIKKKHSNITIINIVVDLPEYTVLGDFKKTLLYRLYSSWDRHQAAVSKGYTDGYVVITKQMGGVLSKEKPYTVVEGICTSVFPEIGPKEDKTVKVIYAGKLNEMFGLRKLLDAFQMIEDQSYELILCGIGDLGEEIANREKEDRRIKYLGQLKREDVLKILITSDIIINPRENIGEFTKYSFPSKVIEALSSGIPFVGYKLEGIPDEYDKFINYPSGDTVVDLANTIVEVGTGKKQEAKAKAIEAKSWITTKKSPKEQGRKVLDLINLIIG